MNSESDDVSVVDGGMEHLAVVVEEGAGVVKFDGGHFVEDGVGVFEVGDFVGVGVK